MKNFKKYHTNKTKESFVGKIAEQMKPLSFYDRHKLTVSLSSALSVGLSVVSIIAGVTALFSLSMMMFGIDDTLMGVFESRPVFAYSLAVGSVLILALIEKAKHHFHSDGLLENFRNTDDNGSMEMKVAFLLSLISCVLSVCGGVLIANELAGTKAQSTITAIQSEWLPKIEKQEALLAEYQGDGYKNNKGKTLYKVLPIIEETKTQLSSLSNDYQTALVNAGVSDKVGMTYNATATVKVAALLGGLQIFVELALFGCLYWIVWFKYRVYTESNSNPLKEETQPPKEVTTVANGQYFQPFQPFPPVSINETQPPKEVTVVKGFNVNRYKDTQQPPTQPIQTPKTIVTQQSQVQTKVFDYSQTRSNLNMYLNRIHYIGYTDKKIQGIKRYAGALIENGYKVIIDYNDGEPSLTIDDKDSPTLKVNEKYLIEYEGQVRIYYPDLTEKLSQSK